MDLDPSRLKEASAERRTISTTAPAKINLALAVDKPRKDGMHPIASWMTPIDLADDLSVTRLEDDRMSRYAIIWHDDAPVPSTIDWSITKDLAVRAHMAIEERAGRKLPVQMKLEKRIPVGGGLGGGSSDAAAMLLAVNDLFELGASLDDLNPIAHALGSDVPFFLSRSAATIEDMGQIVSPTPPVACDLVLVMPSFGCNTGAVYRAFDESPPDSFRAGAARSLAASALPDPGELFNDLADAAIRVSPALSDLMIDVARVTNLKPHITGSGSTLFLLCPDGEDAAVDLADDIASEIDGVSAIATRALG